MNRTGAFWQLLHVEAGFSLISQFGASSRRQGEFSRMSLRVWQVRHAQRLAPVPANPPELFDVRWCVFAAEPYAMTSPTRVSQPGTVKSLAKHGKFILHLACVVCMRRIATVYYHVVAW